jgi:hypothetical protein
MSDNPTNEFKAFQQVHNALVELDEDAQARVLSSVSTLLGISAPVSAAAKPSATLAVEDDVELDTGGNVHAPQNFTEFAELYAATDPHSNSDKALVAGYWIQVCQGADNFSGQAINNELNHLGHKISNITNALSSLNEAKPQLVLQLRKSGKTQQARKTYKLSGEGIKRVKDMISAT